MSVALSATDKPPHLNLSPPCAERGWSYAASALAGFSGAVIAPEVLISATSLSE
jgi:hypothetical protein